MSVAEVDLARLKAWITQETIPVREAPAVLLAGPGPCLSAQVTDAILRVSRCEHTIVPLRSDDEAREFFGELGRQLFALSHEQRMEFFAGDARHDLIHGVSGLMVGLGGVQGRLVERRAGPGAVLLPFGPGIRSRWARAAS